MRKLSPKSLMTTAILGVLFLSSCTIRSKEEGTVISGTPTVSKLYVKVLDYESETPIQTASVMVAIDINGNGIFEDNEHLNLLTTNDAGNTRELEFNTGQKVKVVVHAPRYATFYRVYDSAEQVPSVIKLFKAERVDFQNGWAKTDQVEVHVGNGEQLGINRAEISLINVGESPQNMPGDSAECQKMGSR